MEKNNCYTNYIKNIKGDIYNDILCNIKTYSKFSMLFDKNKINKSIIRYRKILLNYSIDELKKFINNEYQDIKNKNMHICENQNNKLYLHLLSSLFHISSPHKNIIEIIIFLKENNILDKEIIIGKTLSKNINQKNLTVFNIDYFLIYYYNKANTIEKNKINNLLSFDTQSYFYNNINYFENKKIIELINNNINEIQPYIKEYINIKDLNIDINNLLNNLQRISKEYNLFNDLLNKNNKKCKKL